MKKIPYNPEKPYCIGLTGGLASGKSTIRKDLENLGAATIDCDKLGHRAYEKNTRGYDLVVETFGRDILDSSGNIDRKLLGNKVFGKKEELNKLNSIVWPEIKNLLEKEIKILFEKGHNIIVIEAPVLLESKQSVHLMNEIWVSFVPEDEAVKRYIERNASDEQKARSILSSQISNADKIKQANVIFCTTWKREYTIKQVNKAWNLLLQRIKQYDSKSL